MRSLVIVEHDNRAFAGCVRNAVGAAGKLAGPVDLLVAGSGCGEVARAVARIDGVCRVLWAEAPHYGDQLPENLGELVVSLADEYSHIIAAATRFGKALLPRVAACLDVAQVSDIVAVEADDVFVRPAYAGSVLLTVQSADRLKVVTVRATAFEAAGESAESARIEEVAPTAQFSGSRLVAREVRVDGRPELASAPVVIAGGRGLRSAEDFREILGPLAERFGAALGATRAAVDAGFVANELQIGQTGVVVAPRLYFAIGLSGAIQHVAGMKDSQTVVAINRDAEAPIFQIADYGLVADLFDAVPRLVAELEALGDGARCAQS